MLCTLFDTLNFTHPVEERNLVVYLPCLQFVGHSMFIKIVTGVYLLLEVVKWFASVKCVLWFIIWIAWHEAQWFSAIFDNWFLNAFRDLKMCLILHGGSEWLLYLSRVHYHFLWILAIRICTFLELLRIHTNISMQFRRLLPQISNLWAFQYIIYFFTFFLLNRLWSEIHATKLYFLNVFFYCNYLTGLALISFFDMKPIYGLRRHLTLTVPVILIGPLATRLCFIHDYFIKTWVFILTNNINWVSMGPEKGIWLWFMISVSNLANMGGHLNLKLML